MRATSRSESPEGRSGGASPAPAVSPTVGEITTFWLGFALGAFAPAAFLAARAFAGALKNQAYSQPKK
jgi:hypothetical protein